MKHYIESKFYDSGQAEVRYTTEPANTEPNGLYEHHLDEIEEGDLLGVVDWIEDNLEGYDLHQMASQLCSGEWIDITQYV